MNEPLHLTAEQLQAGLAHILDAPNDSGTVEMIVRRPAVNQREELEVGELDLEQGLVGDNWLSRGFGKSDEDAAHPDMQLNIMGARAIDLVAGSRARWSLAGDQFFVDLDLSADNLPPGTRLELGEALIEVTAEPHLGCKKFVARFGLEAMKFVNSGAGKTLNLRGINARVVKHGTVRRGDRVVKLP